MAAVDNFYFFIFFRLTCEFLGLESEHEGSICWPNNKIIDDVFLSLHTTLSTFHMILTVWPLACPNIWTQSTKLYLLPLLSPHCRMELVMQRTGWSSRAPKIDDEEATMLTLSVLCHASANFVCRMAASALALSSRHQCRTPRIAVLGLLVVVAPAVALPRA